MKNFYLVKKEDNRVILTQENTPVDEILEIITATNWCTARSKVVEARFYNTLGHGWRCR